MNLSALAILALSVGTTLAAPVPKELKHRPDAQRMQGLWMAHNPDGSQAGRWYFTGEKLFAGGSDTTDNKGHEYTITLRAGAEFTEIDIANSGSLAFTGVYKFVGEELHVAYRSGADRAKAFNASGGANVHILKRLPEGKK